MMHPHELEFSEAQMRESIVMAMDKISELVNTIDEQDTDRSADADMTLIRAAMQPLPESGVPLAELLDWLFGDACTKSLNTTSPGFMAYVPGGGIFHAALADLIGNSINRYVGVVATAPALSQIEVAVINWFASIIGYELHPSGGFLTSGGSSATLAALTTARTVKLGSSFSDAVIYTSDQSHFCISKAAFLAGFPRENLRVLPADENFRLQPDTIREEMEKDRASGLRPFLIGVNAGSTNTGAVDPLPELADLAEAEDLWLHVDGAYGGLFCMTERGKHAMRGIERADSVVLDPHKTLFLPYGTGALIVKDGVNLRQTYSATAAYMPEMQHTDEAIDMCEVTPELTRPFRGLRVWLPLKMHGAGVFREYLDEKIDLAQWVCEQIEEIPDLDVVAKPVISILAFAVREEGRTRDEANKLTRDLINKINTRQRVSLTGTTIHGRFLIRIAVGGFRTHMDRMEMLVDDLKACLAEVLSAPVA